jgi:hypothetical protein
MEKTCQYYWDKVAERYFSNLSYEKKLELAYEHLSKDERLHFEELLKR